MATMLDAQCRTWYADAARQRVCEQIHNVRSAVNKNPRQHPGSQVAGPVQELNFDQHRTAQVPQQYWCRWCGYNKRLGQREWGRRWFRAAKETNKASESLQ